MKIYKHLMLVASAIPLLVLGAAIGCNDDEVAAADVTAPDDSEATAEATEDVAAEATEDVAAEASEDVAAEADAAVDAETEAPLDTADAEPADAETGPPPPVYEVHDPNEFGWGYDCDYICGQHHMTCISIGLDPDATDWKYSTGPFPTESGGGSCHAYFGCVGETCPQCCAHDQSVGDWSRCRCSG